jgi:two-component system, chemotaxis family, protein-glutamate methylesterase/glutaminase
MSDYAVVIGASAGGVQTLRNLAQNPDPALPVAYFVVLHLAPGHPSYLPEVLGRSGKLRALHPADGSAAKNGVIYIAPPDKHMIVTDGKIELSAGPKENHHRPSINVLFRSAALAYGPKAIGIVLSGFLDDGTDGLWFIKKRGGIAIVQRDALHPSMVENAIKHVKVDYNIPLQDIPGVLARLLTREKERPAMRTQSGTKSMQH